ncbi:MAG: PaaI family thioesterase [Chloroflexota bacterium]
MATKAEIIAFLQTDFPQFRASIESVGDQSCRLRQVVADTDLRPGGTVSRPVLFALADSALYVAVLGEIGIVPLAVTTNITINFLRRPTPDADLIAECKLIKVGRKLIVGEVSLYSDGNPDPISHAVGTYAVPPDKYK